MSQLLDEPRFTIEQIDLLQRLRRTGMTQPEILHALDTLERLDRQHGHKFGHRPSHSNASSSSSSNSNANTTSCSSNNVTASSSTTTATAATQTTFRVRGLASEPPANDYDASPPLPAGPAPVAVAPAAQNGRADDGLVALSNGKLSPPRFPVSVGSAGGSGVVARGYGFETGEEDMMDVDDKVEELMRRDSTLIKEEIKAFLGNRRISQAVVAQVTGISQSRISHWLLQQGSDLSEQKKRAFFRWYQLEKTNPGNAHPPQPQDSPPAAPLSPAATPNLPSVQSLFSCSTRSIHY